MIRARTLIRALVLGAALLVSLTSLTSRASDIPVSTILDAADARYAELDYRAAAELSQKAAHDPRATGEEQARAWERVGISWLVLGQKNLAQEAFDQLFTLDPRRDVLDPGLSPRQREFIEDARRAHPIVEDTPKPLDVAPIVHAPPPPARPPLWKRWYLWTGVGAAVAVGLGVGLGVGLANRSHGTLPPGVISVGLRF